jgi:quercetin dioxygenase-like cupin family protein
VISGSGELRLDGGPVAFAGGQGVHIPAGVWHAVANTGDADVVMVFGFPHPDYPPTQRRET